MTNRLRLRRWRLGRAGNWSPEHRLDGGATIDLRRSRWSKSVPSCGIGYSSGAQLFVARHLLSGSKQYRSITLEADAHHLMTDVWTSAGVVAAIAIVALTGWTRLDAVIALCVAVNILLTGARLLRRHTLRTRQAGVRSFISFHSARA